jgi:hypothetical protein
VLLSPVLLPAPVLEVGAAVVVGSGTPVLVLVSPAPVLAAVVPSVAVAVAVPVSAPVLLVLLVPLVLSVAVPSPPQAGSDVRAMNANDERPRFLRMIQPEATTTAR